MARKRKSTTSSASSISLGGIKYKKVSCHTTVTAAKNKVKELRKAGYTAVERGKCVFKGRKRKTSKKRR